MEGAVSTLIEEQALPFGIDDALEQFKQCTQVLRLIDIPYLAKITQYSTELMQRLWRIQSTSIPMTLLL